MNETYWFAETGGTHIHIDIRFRAERLVYSGRSAFQDIDIVDTVEFGRMLFLDRVAQSAERDEFIYHEAMVHPAALTHPRPRSALVIGGAEGASLREIFKHPDITRVVMVDIDDQLVDLCRRHLPTWHAGAFDDPRLELCFGDGRLFLTGCTETFDLIIIDLSDPLPDSPAIYLFTQEFYQLIYDRLSPNGVAAFQGESFKPWLVELHARMVNTLSRIFPVVAAYPYYLPCFHEPYAHILASKDQDPRRIDLGGRLHERGLQLGYISPSLLPGLFGLPAFVEQAYQRYPDILTDEKPFLISRTG